LLAYAIGMFFYLGRDVLVRVFYGLQDGTTPLKLTVWGLLLNAGFCFLFTKSFGAPGLAMATVGVNIISMIVLLWILQRRLHGLPWREMGLPILGIAIASILCGLVSWLALLGCQRLWGTEGLFLQLLQLALAGLAGSVVFGALVWKMKLPEVDFFLGRIQQRLPFRKK
jgi:putative peptidoglycan lipid II flippase